MVAVCLLVLRTEPEYFVRLYVLYLNYFVCLVNVLRIVFGETGLIFQKIAIKENCNTLNTVFSGL